MKYRSQEQQFQHMNAATGPASDLLPRTRRELQEMHFCLRVLTLLLLGTVSSVGTMSIVSGNASANRI